MVSVLFSLLITAGGGDGDSCVSSNDCETPLRCRKQVCYDPRAPAQQQPMQQQPYSPPRPAPSIGQRPPPTQVGSINVISQTPGAQVVWQLATPLPTPATLTLPLGEQTITVEAPGYVSVTRRVVVTRSARTEDFALESMETAGASINAKRTIMRVSGIAAIAVGGVLVISGITAATLRPSYVDLNDRYGRSPSAFDLKGIQDTVRTDQTLRVIFPVFLTTGLVLAAAGAVVLALAPAKPRTMLSVSVGQNAAMLTATGVF